MKYSELLQLLFREAESDFADFQRKLIPTKQKIIGVRAPILRKIAKKLQNNFKEIFSYPDEYFEVTFIKLAVLSTLPYDLFCANVRKGVFLIDNWATCDCFKGKCIAGNKEEFLPILEELFLNGGDFYVRYVLVTLLYFYVEKEYLPVVKRFLRKTDTTPYYVHMAAAWLTAEILVKYYEEGIALLQEGILERKTHNKAIQKAIESYRITKEQKAFLRSLKIKTE